MAKNTISTYNKFFISQPIWKLKYYEEASRMNCGGSNNLNRIKIDPWKGD